ncbi:DNA-binding response regulator [Betaproteobacteria bacterium]|nr:DNA-binding response regulator [Betaproteobacteria bacterium]
MESPRGFSIFSIIFNPLTTSSIILSFIHSSLSQFLQYAMKTRILLVEDDDRLAKLTAEYLQKNDFDVSIETRGDTAETRILVDDPDLVILDIMLPGKDGFDVCRSVRATYKGVILMLTARDEDFDQILGLELGADDYLAKPVQPRLLLARIKALLRRTPVPAGTTEYPVQGDEAELAFGYFRISQATRSAFLGDETIDLTTAEFDLLWLLALHAGNILSRDDLLQELRGIGFDGIDRSIDARISRLRRKLGDDPENPTRIKTVRGKGYLFSKHDWQ